MNKIGINIVIEREKTDSGIIFIASSPDINVFAEGKDIGEVRRKFIGAVKHHFETFPEGEDEDVRITTICGGPLRSKTFAQGYGGVATQECLLKNQPILVVYGHLRLASIDRAVGAYLAPGTYIGNLGRGFTHETDGERKHLHLGVVRGSAPDLRGYVQDQSELSRWIDPVDLLEQGTTPLLLDKSIK